MEHMIIKEARRSWIRLAILAATFALLAVLGAAASPAHAAYDFESTTNPDNARDYAEVILNDNGFGHADTYINLSEADRSEDGKIYVRYTQNACPYQDLRVELLGNLPNSSWNRVDLDTYSVYIKSELDRRVEEGYGTISVDNEEKVVEETLSTFYDDPKEGYLTRDNIIRISSFVDKDDNDKKLTGGASLRITLNPTKTLQNCQIELDKELYGYEDTPEPTVTWMGQKLTKGKDYEIDEVYTNAGSEQSYITLKGIGDFANSDYYLLYRSVDYKVDWDKEHITDDSDNPDNPDNPVLPAVSKKANPMTVKAKTVTGKAKKNTTIAAAKAFTVKNNVGKVTYKKTSGDNKITVAKTGKVTVKKGLKKNKTYTVKVKVTDPGDKYYKSGSKTVSLKVSIK